MTSPEPPLEPPPPHTAAARPTRAALTVFTLALVLVAGLTLHLLSAFFGATVLALVLVALAHPMYVRVLARVRRPAWAAVLVTMALVLLVVLPLAGFAASLVNEVWGLVRATRQGALAAELASLLQGEGQLLERVRGALAGVGLEVSAQSFAGFVDELLRGALGFASARLSALATDTVSLVVHFCYMAVLVGAILMHGPALRAFLFDLSPLPDDEDQRIAQRFRDMARAVFLGNGVASALQGLVGGITFAIFEVGPPLVWGTVIGVLAFLPLLGSSIVLVPAAGYLALRAGVATAALFLAVNAVAIAALEYGLKPRLIGDRASLPAVLVFVGIVAGIASYGLLGIFLGPLVLTTFLTLVDLWRTRYRDSWFPSASAPASPSADKEPPG